MQRKKCKARKTLKNDALDAKIGVDTAENEPLKVLLNQMYRCTIHPGHQFHSGQLIALVALALALALWLGSGLLSAKARESGHLARLVSQMGLLEANAELRKAARNLCGFSVSFLTLITKNTCSCFVWYPNNLNRMCAKRKT